MSPRRRPITFFVQKGGELHEVWNALELEIVRLQITLPLDIQYEYDYVATTKLTDRTHDHSQTIRRHFTSDYSTRAVGNFVLHGDQDLRDSFMGLVRCRVSFSDDGRCAASADSLTIDEDIDWAINKHEDAYYAFENPDALRAEHRLCLISIRFRQSVCIVSAVFVSLLMSELCAF